MAYTPIRIRKRWFFARRFVSRLGHYGNIEL